MCEDERPKQDEAKWLSASTELYDAAEDLLIAAKRFARAYDQNRTVSEKVRERLTPEGMESHPIGALFKAMGMGWEPTWSTAEATWRSQYAKVRVGQALDHIFNNVGEMPSPAQLEEHIQAYATKLYNHDGTDMFRRLHNDLEAMEKGNGQSDTES